MVDLRPDSYDAGRGPQSGASDLMTYMSGSAHHNTRMENAANRPSMKQEDHPAHNMPTATEDHSGTVLKDNTRYGDDAGGDYSTNQAQFWARREENK